VSLAAIVAWPGLSLTLVDLVKEKPKPVMVPTTGPAPEVPPTTGKEKSLEELMKGVKSPGAEAPPAGKEKSLEELMRDAKEKAQPGGEPASAAPAVEKTMQELMQEAKQRQADAGL
jgi:hypothetical protein